MAYTEIDVETPGTAGVLTTEATAADVANGNMFANDGQTLLYFAKGAGGASTTATIGMADTRFGDTVTAETVLVLTTEHTFIGPFPVARHNLTDDEAGMVTVDFGGVDTTNITLMPFH